MDKLKMEMTVSDEIAVAKLEGVIDHHTVRSVRDEIDAAMYKSLIKQLVLDFSGVDFMDSSGLGLILGRYTKITDMGGRLSVVGVSDEIMKIIRLAGAEKIIDVEKRAKTVKKKESKT